MSQLNLPHGNNNQKVEKPKKTKNQQTDMLRSNSKSLGNHAVSPEEEERKAAVGRICRKGRF